jgi:hypothetical protein
MSDLVPPPPAAAGYCNSTVLAKATQWSVAQRLGNTLLYLGRALMYGEMLGGSVSSCILILLSSWCPFTPELDAMLNHMHPYTHPRSRA